MEFLTGMHFEIVLGLLAIADFSFQWNFFILYLGHFLLRWNNRLLINLLKRLFLLDYWLQHLM